MVKLDGMATFVAVAESGSISEASRRLNFSKSVVSERLADLEKELGVRLLHRSTRKLTLTEDGATFLARASAIMREIEEATAELAQRRGTLVGPLRISAPVTFGRMHLGPALYPFIAAHPGVELTLELDDRRVDAASDGYDGVVRNGPLADSRLVAWTLARSRRALVASPDYLAQHGRPASAEDLQRHRGVFYTNRGVADWQFRRDGELVSVRASRALRVNNGDMMRDACEAGLGIALLPTFIVGESLRAGRLVAIDIGLPSEEEFLYVAHPEGRSPSAKLRAMTDALKTAFGDPPYWDSDG
ncbi:LysR family transcriptional regulator [Variovorax ginsengisoli]|jgi:DNA-binding transcriptional LysR family regulator|uniref:LysR family transcriptional regulator n=1 Tax=Variovorax ginsengisoli TaxID=363844 RepID=A0ABT8S9B5_9BURK|nr:LysR family transcriptional regulator [Variovorax ginsengisoli]MDN8616328.1 LysR family transcriptional regulator [Variovorax ginsengisoli]MDO1535498.1 LysR family transcriptional regulator [Variovorax ginsengisoli]